MKKLWNRVDGLNLKAGKKLRLFRLTLEFSSALLGLLIWLLIQNRILNTWDWLICFIGYPVMITWIASMLYSCNHDFHDGKQASL